MPPLRSARGQAPRSRDSTRLDFLLAFWQRRGVTIIGATMQLPRYSPAAPAATSRALCFSFRTVCRSPFDGSPAERLL
jgi:replication-associated recombination protein RarA